MIIITGPQGKVFNNKKCMTRHLKRDFKCIYFSFMYFFYFFYSLEKKKALESRGNFVVNFNWMWSKRKKGRKELKSYFCTTKKNCKNNDCFQTDLPLSVIGLTTIIPPQTHVTA